MRIVQVIAALALISATTPAFSQTVTLTPGPVAFAQRSGSTNTVATSSGSLTNGDCVELDGNGNYVDAGGPCTTGGGSGTVNSGTAGQITYYATTGTAVSGNVNATISSGALTLGQTGSVLGDLLLSGSSTGKVTIQPQAAAGTYNFNLPITAGFSTDVLTSGGGSSAAMTWTPVATTATASTLGKRDSNANFFTNNTLSNATVTVGSGGTTTLTSASSRYQGLSTAAQTFVLPDATTLSLGPWFVFNNNTAGALTINKNGGTLQYTVPAGGITQCGPTDISTAAGSWDCHSYLPGTISWGSGTTGLVMNTALSTAPAISGGASSATAPAFKPQSGTSNTGFSGDSTHLYGVVGGATVSTTDATGFNIPSGHTYQINGTQIAAADLSNGTTGSGNIVLANTPTLITPVIGAATGTSLSLSSNILSAGYANFGSQSAPTNTTAGDLTAIRLSVNGGGAFNGTNGLFGQFGGSITATSGFPNGFLFQPTFAPASASSATVTGIALTPTINTSQNLSSTGINATTIYNNIVNSGTIAGVVGFNTTGLVAGSGAASLGNVTSVTGLGVAAVSSTGNSLTATISSTYGIKVQDNVNSGSGPLTITAEAGLAVAALSTGTHHTDGLFGSTSISTSANYGIYEASSYLNQFVGNVRTNGVFDVNGTDGLASKTCTINTANVTTGITLTITGGIITGTTTC
ncbi:MAG: hypothetical protein KGL39_04605 [Patescibacteria group bacterium]|nr:hypothetical protein [Patescibacteria group bacterium]